MTPYDRIYRVQLCFGFTWFIILHVLTLTLHHALYATAHLIFILILYPWFLGLKVKRHLYPSHHTGLSLFVTEK